MKSILKWTGGKTSELPFILKHIENLKTTKKFEMERYVEPFLGGGALYFNLEFENSVVNDFNQDLICFYQNCHSSNKKFFNLIVNFQKLREEFNSKKHIEEMFLRLLKLFRYKEEELISGKLSKILIDNKKIILDYFIENIKKIDELKNFSEWNEDLFKTILNKEINQKIKIIEKNILESKKTEPLFDEINLIIATVLNATLYYYIRHIFNVLNKSKEKDVKKSYLYLFSWFVMRELSYSGMFRFSKKGDFNVPYGGISYNKKDLINKLNLIQEFNQKPFFNKTKFNNLDFVDFFEKYHFFKKGDFIFLDPPYDSEFSQYNVEKDFDKQDQIKLKDCLIQSIKNGANVLLIIKKTDFILDLYSKNGAEEFFKIDSFNKNYSVNFKNRNNQKVKHLVIYNK